MTSAALSGGSTATYVYDALGRRVRRFTSANVEDTKFTYDGDDVLLDDDKGTITKYLNGDGIDSKLRATTGSVASYFLADHLGSTNGLADSTGAVTSQTAYDSFGNRSNTTFPNRYQFTGREFDTFTGLQFSRARWYDPKIGRFISEDPIGFGGGDTNLYAYVRNRSLATRDPSGLQPNPLYPSCVIGWGLLGGTVGFTAGGGLGVLAGPGAPATVPAGAVYGATFGTALGAAIGPFACGTPPFPNQSDTWSTPKSSSPPVPYCEPIRKPTFPWDRPFPISPAIPFARSEPVPQPSPDREGCPEEISACVQLCARARFDPDMKNIWGGSQSTCMNGCVSERCKRGLRF